MHEKVLHAWEQGSPSINVKMVQNGETKSSFLPISLLSAHDVFVIFAPLLLSGVAFLLIGLLVFLISPSPPGLIPFLVYCASAGTYLLTAYDFHTTYVFIPLLLVAFAAIPPSVIHLSFSFPKALSNVGTSRGVIVSAYFMSFIFWFSYYLLFHDNPVRWVWVEFVFFLYLSLAYLWWVAVMARRAFVETDETVRRQCRIILVPLVPAFGTIFIATWLVWVFHVPAPLNLVVPLCIFFPAAIAYAMFRGNLFMVDHLEAQVKERTEALQKTQTELLESKKLAAVGLLSAGTAHEIGNAMNLISSNLPVLKNYSERLLALTEGFALPPEKKKEIDFDFMKQDLPELLKNLERGAERANRIAGDLKNFSKPPSEVREPVDLSELVHATLRLLKAEIGSRVVVNTNLPSVPSVMGSSGQIQQVVLNLVLNALQSMDGKGSIDITLKMDAKDIVLVIQDSGKGIAKDALTRLFEPFYSTKEGGTGLGLSVSYGIVQSHGGKLTVTSEVGKGTRVQLSLPVL